MRIPYSPPLRKTSLVIIAALMVTGCSTFFKQPKKSQETANPPSTEIGENPSFSERTEGSQQGGCYFHVVKWPGESLSIISKWYTGTLDHWKTIAKSNPELDPRVIRVGARIRIPEEIVKNPNPMSQDFVTSFYSKGTREKGSIKSTPSPPPDQDEPKLIGPKPYSDN